MRSVEYMNSSSDDDEEMEAIMLHHRQNRTETTDTSSASQPAEVLRKQITPRERHSIGSKFHYWTDEMVSSDCCAILGAVLTVYVLAIDNSI